MQRLVALGKLGRGIFHPVWTQLGKTRWLFDLAIGQAAANRRTFLVFARSTAPTLEGWREVVRRTICRGRRPCSSGWPTSICGPRRRRLPFPR